MPDALRKALDFRKRKIVCIYFFRASRLKHYQIGHRPPNMTNKRYFHLVPDMLKKAVDDVRVDINFKRSLKVYLFYLKFMINLIIFIC